MNSICVSTCRAYVRIYRKLSDVAIHVPVHPANNLMFDLIPIYRARVSSTKPFYVSTFVGVYSPKIVITVFAHDAGVLFVSKNGRILSREKIEFKIRLFSIVHGKRRIFQFFTFVALITKYIHAIILLFFVDFLSHVRFNYRPIVGV